MARLVQAHHLSSSLSFFFTTTTTTLLLLLVAILAVSSIIFSLCTTNNHKKKGRQLPTSPPPSMTAAVDRKLASALSGISSKALVAAKTVTWKKYSNGNDEDVVWKKSILMGEKCRPLDFSGQIIYDAEGNEMKAVPPPPGRGVSGAGKS